MTDFLKDADFIKLEKEFKFLSRARSKHGELEQLSYIVVDLETTGLDPANDEIIEIGAIKIGNGEVKDIFNKLIKPERQIPAGITELTGISQEMVNDELPIKPVLEKFAAFIDDSILMAHNADFDISFLKNNFKKYLNKDLHNFTVCTLLVARDILPNLENHKLHTIAKYFGVEVANRHRAIGDVEVTYQVWQNLSKKLKDRNIATKQDLESYMGMLDRSGSETASLDRRKF